MHAVKCIKSVKSSVWFAGLFGGTGLISILILPLRNTGRGLCVQMYLCIFVYIQIHLCMYKCSCVYLFLCFQELK